MTTQLMVQQPYEFNAEFYNNLRQNAPGEAPAVLQLPKEILEAIVKLATTGQTAFEAAKSIVTFGKVCAYAHIITCLPNLNNIIRIGLEEPKWVVDAKDSFRYNLVDGSGQVISTVRKVFFM